MTKNTRSEKPYDISITSILRGLSLLFIPLTSYVLGLFPILLGFIYINTKLLLLFQGMLYYLLLSVLLVFSFIFLILIESFFPVIFARILRIKVKPGNHQIHISDKNFYYHMLFFTLYRPSLKLISILPFTPFRSKLVKLAGLTIGKTSLLAGTEFIDEPYGVTIGEHTLIGGLSTIYAHVSHETMRLKPITIGNNCFIGNKSVIMPGVKIEDNVLLEPGSVVGEDQVLIQGKRYAGNPAQIISETSN